MILGHFHAGGHRRCARDRRARRSSWSAWRSTCSATVSATVQFDTLTRRYQLSRSVDGRIFGLDAKDAFSQVDADYLPIPFARGLRITWEGKINELHFYHVQVRLYPKGTAVRTFDPKKDLKEFESVLRTAAAGLTQPASACKGEPARLAGVVKPGTNWVWSPEAVGPGAVCEWKLRLRSAEQRGDLASGRSRDRHLVTPRRVPSGGASRTARRCRC